MAWNPFGVQFELSASSGGVTRTSATQYTVKINASWETYYSGAQTNYGMTASSGGSSVNLNTFGKYASSGSGSFTGTYSISGNGAATKSVTVTFRNYNNDNGDSKTTTVSFNVNVPDWTSYKVSYNANGGSGAPSSQTKWKDQTLTLSSTKPTRSGYTFKGWALTKSDADNGAWYYQAGSSCGKNENLTLYATWEEHKLTVNYYRNNATYASFKGTEVTENLVHSQDFLYDNPASSGLADVQNTEYVYMSRNGYTPTGYWGTSTNGGTVVNQSTTFATGQALAQAFGKSLVNGNASVNIYPQWKGNSYIIHYNSNGGYGEMNDQYVDWQENFTLYNNTFNREGYKFIGWKAHRESDDTWYVIGKGWLTEDKIAIGEPVALLSSDNYILKDSNNVYLNALFGYQEKLYENQSELIFDNSWISGYEGISEYTMYAIWEISGVVYIDNGTSFEPYLAYIDNGTDWELYLAYIDNGTDWDIIS